MLTHYALTPADVVYFEHNPEAVESARSVGITTYWCDYKTRPFTELRSFIENNIE
jgi:FMN phosphatase YigB (HAD superfamily)